MDELGIKDWGLGAGEFKLTIINSRFKTHGQVYASGCGCGHGNDGTLGVDWALAKISTLVADNIGTTVTPLFSVRNSADLTRIDLAPALNALPVTKVTQPLVAPRFRRLAHVPLLWVRP